MNRQPTDIPQVRGTGRIDQVMNPDSDRASGGGSTKFDEQNNVEQRKTLQQHFRLVEVLEKIPLFRGLSMHQFKQILKIFKSKTVPKDQVLCKIGEESFEIFILLRGNLKLLFEDGKEFSRISPIGIVGEMGVFTGDRRSATIAAATDCLLLSIHKSELMRALRADAGLSTKVLFNVIDTLSEKIRHDNRIIEDLRQICPPGRWTQIIKDAESEKK